MAALASFPDLPSIVRNSFRACGIFPWNFNEINPSINFPSAQRRPTTDIGTGRRCRPTSVPGRQREAANGGPTADINSRLMSALVGLCRHWLDYPT